MLFVYPVWCMCACVCEYCMVRVCVCAGADPGGWQREGHKQVKL